MKQADWLNIYTIGRSLGFRNVIMYQWRSRYKEDKPKRTRGVPAAERDDFVEAAKDFGLEYITHAKFKEWDKR